MVSRTTVTASAQSAGELARRAVCACVLVAALLHAQRPVLEDPAVRLLALDAARLAQSPDPTVRGEAALALAATGNARYYELVLAVAKDPVAGARLRGIIALGYLAAPGSEPFLTEQVNDSGTRARPEGIAAAFALGLLPDEQAPAAVTGYLMRFLGSSFKRQRDVLLALLAGLAGHDPVTQQRGLLALLDDAANRDPVVRQALLQVLARIPGALAPERVEAALLRGSAEERRAVLEALATRVEADKALLAPLARICTQDVDGRSRALALAVLTRMRHLPALDLAARAVRGGEPVEVEQGTRTALLLGGSAMRAAIEQQLDALPPARQTALLAAFQGPLSAGFAEQCLKLAGNRQNALPLRTAAALVLAQAEAHRALPVLRDVFLDARDSEALRPLARALLRLEEQPPDLARLQGNGRLDDLALLPERLAALIAAGHPQALRFCLQQFERKDLDAAAAAGLLRAFRCSALAALPADAAAVLPGAVHEVLQ